MDKFRNFPSNIESPAEYGTPVTASDLDELETASRKLYVGGTGNVVVDLVGGSANLLFANVQSGSTLDIRVAKVKATGTTATNILALW